MRKQVILSVILAVITLSAVPFVSAIDITAKTSANWSGYVATAPQPYTQVSASWVIPSVTSTSTPAFSAIWTGIGGWFRNGNKLIQAGSEQDVLSGGAEYSVWYEIYPKAPVTVTTANAHDSVYVNIFENAGKPNTWHITIQVNSVTKLSSDFKVNTNFAAEATAEWIVERPLLVLGHQLAPLADFGTATFSSCTVNGEGLSSQTSAIEVMMTRDGTSSGTLLTQPTALSGDSFSVVWAAAS